MKRPRPPHGSLAKAVLLEERTEVVPLDRRERRGLGEVALGAREQANEEVALEVVDGGSLRDLEVERVAFGRRVLESDLAPAVEEAVEGEILGPDDRTVAQDRGALDDVLELTGIAREGARPELLERLAGERARALDVSRETTQELTREQLDVLRALRERGDHEPHLGETEVEVVAEEALVHHPSKIAPRRRHHAHRDGSWLRLSEADDDALLEHTKQLGLEGEGQLADLVEEDGPTLARFEDAHTRLGGAGERAADVTEEDRLGERARDGAAVEHGERTPRISTLVQRPRDDLFAAPRRPFDENAEVGRADALERRVEGAHRSALADEASVRVTRRSFADLARGDVEAHVRLPESEDTAGGNDRLRDACALEERSVPGVEIADLDAVFVGRELDMELGHRGIRDRHVAQARSTEGDLLTYSGRAGSRAGHDDRADAARPSSGSENCASALVAHGYTEISGPSAGHGFGMGDRYTILGSIANGGMAQVYLARMVASAGFSRLVAIKRLHDRMSADREFLAMLIDEARLTAQIRHTNVVDILDVVVRDGTFALVLEWVEGASLSALVKRAAGEPIPLPIVLAIIQGVLRGLSAAHEARSEDGQPLGIVHRDISPQNVLVGVDGIPRIIDFGVAKASGRLEETRPGEIRGKYAYMAPEQLLARPVTAQVDIYATGVILWELLAGKRLFKADDERVVCASVLRGDIPAPSSIRSDLPAGLDEIVARLVAREQSSRFLDAREVLSALEPFGRATEDEVGAWARSLAADDIEAHQSLIRNAVPPAARSLDSLLSELDDEPSSQPSARRSLPRASRPSLVEAEQTFTDTAVSRNVLESETGGMKLRRPSLPLLVAAGSFATLAVLGVIIGLMSLATAATKRRGELDPATPPAASYVPMPMSNVEGAPATPSAPPTAIVSAPPPVGSELDPPPVPAAAHPSAPAPRPAAKKPRTPPPPRDPTITR